MRIAVLGIDLGKNSCSVVGLDAAGRAVLRRRVSRDGVVELAAGLPRCVVAMEACSAARTTSAACCAPKGTRCG
jgi:transposase